MTQRLRFATATVSALLLVAGIGPSGLAAPLPAKATFAIQLKKPGQLALTMNGKAFGLPADAPAMKQAFGAPAATFDNIERAAKFYGYVGNGLQFQEDPREGSLVSTYLLFVGGEGPTGLASKGLKVTFDLPIRPGASAADVKRVMGKPAEEQWEPTTRNPERWGFVSYQRGTRAIDFLFKDKHLAGVSIY